MFNKTLNLLAKIGTAAIVLASFGFTGCEEEASPENTLKLYMPTEYMSDDFIPNFEKQFGAKVKVTFFDSNEDMYDHVNAGDIYDVLIPSDYMIERLLKEKMLQPLDQSALTNIDELSNSVKNLSLDPNNNYSVPYFWGNTGIVYDTRLVSTDVVEKEGWSIFHNEEYAGKVYFYDSERDGFMVALKALHLSANTTDSKSLNSALEWLEKMNKTMRPVYVTDEVIDDMAEGKKDIAFAIAYSGDATYILSENENMAYLAPKEGTNVWYDAMVIPAKAENPALANKFINYAISYEAALANTKAVGYTSPNAKAYADMIKKGGDYEYNSAYKPRTDNSEDEVFHDVAALSEFIASKWPLIKSSK